MKSFLITVTASILLVHAAGAQSGVDLSGTGFFDFVYYLDSPDGNLRDHSGFTYRRIYVTADYGLSDAFSARVRLSADQGTADARGPSVYIKDAYVNWRFHDRHSARFGVLPPPLFEASEAVWGYRSLEEVLVDLSGLASSRDVGLRFSGALNTSGTLGYGFMFANNSDTRPEVDQYKRVYAQLQARSEGWLATIGANYAGYGDVRRNALMVNGVLGHVWPRARAGIDWFVQQMEFVNDEEQTNAGISLFGELPLVPDWSVVARVDRYTSPSLAEGPVDWTFGIVGIAYQPIAQIRIIPNLYLLQREDAENDDVRLRLTIEANL